MLYSRQYSDFFYPITISETESVVIALSMLKTIVKSNRATTIVNWRKNKTIISPQFFRILGAPILFSPTVLRGHESESYK